VVGRAKNQFAFLLLAPHSPLLFMGQEFDAETPFQFFTDFGDPALRKAVTEGRSKERSGFVHESQWWHTVLHSKEDGYEVRVEIRESLQRPVGGDLF
jgi:1,4-alpha-glucan branching enzyme